MVTDKLAADFALMGAPIEADRAVVRNSGMFEVWPANWNSVKAFLHCETQWRTVSTLSGVLSTGIDYTALDVILRRLKLPDQVYDDVRVMEQEALNVFREAAA